MCRSIEVSPSDHYSLVSHSPRVKTCSSGIKIAASLLCLNSWFRLMLMIKSANRESPFSCRCWIGFSTKKGVTLHTLGGSLQSCEVSGFTLQSAANQTQPDLRPLPPPCAIIPHQTEEPSHSSTGITPIIWQKMWRLFIHE